MKIFSYCMIGLLIAIPLGFLLKKASKKQDPNYIVFTNNTIIYPTNQQTVDNFTSKLTNTMKISSFTIKTTYDFRGTNEINAMDKMRDILISLGIVTNEYTIKQLVVARLNANWKDVPEDFRNAPEWAELEGKKLKTKISKLLNTTDPYIIEKVLELPLEGVENPPIKDLEVETTNE